MSIPRRSALALTAASFTRILGANDRVRTGIIGLGTRGTNALVPASLELPTDLTAICDVNRPQFDLAQTIIYKKGAAKPAEYTDYRRMLEHPGLDAVIIATPDHWHAPMTVSACQAGKDVYVEKPLAHTPAECMRIVEAARQYRRVVQVGLQQRSMKIYFEARQMIESGVIGKVEQCETAWGYGSGVVQPLGPATDPPAGFDWEAFQGPAPRRPYHVTRHKRWHQFWEYGGGPTTDVGVHVMDVARWFLGLGMPSTVFASALPPLTPDHIPYVVDGVWKYEGGLVTYSSRKQDMTNLFWGSLGTLFINRAILRTEIFGERNRPSEIKEYPIDDAGWESVKIRNVRNTIVHLKNFLDCVRSRATPNAPPEVGADSTIACQLGIHSIRTGKVCRWNGSEVVNV